MRLAFGDLLGGVSPPSWWRQRGIRPTLRGRCPRNSGGRRSSDQRRRDGFLPLLGVLAFPFLALIRIVVTEFAGSSGSVIMTHTFSPSTSDSPYAQTMPDISAKRTGTGLT